MGADISLIKSFEGAYRRPMADITPILEGIEKLQQKAEEKRKERAANERIRQAKIEQYKSYFPDDTAIAGLPLAYQDNWENYIKGEVEQFSDDAALLASLLPESDEYDQVKMRMDKTRKSIESVKNQLTLFGANKLKYITKNKSNSFRHVNEEGKLDLNQRLYTDELDMRIGTGENERGVIFFSGDGIEEFNYITHENTNGLNDINDIKTYYNPLRVKILEVYQNAVKGNNGTNQKMDEKAMGVLYNDFIEEIIEGATDEQLIALFTAPILSDKALSFESYDEEIQALRSLDEDKTRELRKNLEEQAKNNIKTLMGTMEDDGLLIYDNSLKKKDDDKTKTITTDQKFFNLVQKSINNVFRVSGLGVSPQTQEQYESYMKDLIKKSGDNVQVANLIASELNKDFQIAGVKFTVSDKVDNQGQKMIQPIIANVNTIFANQEAAKSFVKRLQEEGKLPENFDPKDLMGEYPVGVPISVNDPQLIQRISFALKQLNVKPMEISGLTF